MAVVDAQELGASFDCATPACEGGARRAGGLCVDCERRGRPSLEKVRVGDLGLRLPPGLAAEEWTRIARSLFRVGTSVSSALGDALVYAVAARFPPGVASQLVADEFGVEAAWLYSLKYVSSHVAYEDRLPGQSWTSHTLLASLPPEQQRSWLKRAERAGWSSHRLRLELQRASRPRRSPRAGDAADRRYDAAEAASGVPVRAGDGVENVEVEPEGDWLVHLELVILAERERIDAWRAAARSRELALNELAALQLDAAASWRASSGACDMRW